MKKLKKNHKYLVISKLITTFVPSKPKTGVFGQW